MPQNNIFPSHDSNLSLFVWFQKSVTRIRKLIWVFYTHFPLHMRPFGFAYFRAYTKQLM